MAIKVPRTAIIIGAGIGGLATANLLAKAGVAVTIYEQNEQAGGRTGLLELDGFRFDTGPSWYLMPEIFEHYFELLGEKVKDHLDLVRLDPGYKVTFADASSIKIHGKESQDRKTFEALQSGGAKALDTYVEQAGYIYDLATKHFLYNNFNKPSKLLHKDILKAGPRMAAVAGKTIDDNIKKYFDNQKLQQVLEYPAVFLGTSPFKAPAIYSLMSYLDFKQGVFYPQGGMYTIIEALVSIGKKLGVTYEFGSGVDQIITKNSKAIGVRKQDGTKAYADIVISNADLHFTETKLLPQHLQTYPEKYWQKKVAGPSAILMYLGIKGSLPNFEHHNLFFADDWRGNFEAIFDTKEWAKTASLYVCKPSQTDPTVAPKGMENVFVLVPGPAGELSQDRLETLADGYIKHLAKISGVPDLAERIVVKRLFGPNDFTNQFNAWQGTALGMSHTLRQSAMFRPKNVSKKVKNLYYVGGNTVPGIGLPMCLIGAELVYKRLCGDKTSGPLPVLPGLRGEL